MKVQKIVLIIEKAREVIWGRVYYDDNLIVESASSIPELEKKMKKLLKAFHKLDPANIEIDVQYDITGLFEEKNFLNTAIVAERAGINKSLMRQYAAGIKHPSYERVRVIEQVIHALAKELLAVKLVSKNEFVKAGLAS